MKSVYQTDAGTLNVTTGSGDMTAAVYDAIINGKAGTSHSHALIDITGTAVATNDARLSDARTPTAHNHDGSYSALGHTHSYEPANANIQTHVTSAHAPSNAQANADITKAEIEAKLTGAIATHTHSGGGESEQIVIKGSDTANPGTAYADATGLSFVATANKEYIVEGWIRYATNATTVGAKFSCNGPTTPGFVCSVFNVALVTSGMSGGGGSTYNSGVAAASAFSTTDNLAMLNILFNNGTTEGTFSVRFAAETTGTITVKSGSLIRYRQVN